MAEPVITGVRIRGLGPVRDAYVPIRPGLNVLYGKNGSGKSSLLQGIHEALSSEELPYGSGSRVLYFDFPDEHQTPAFRHARWNPWGLIDGWVGALSPDIDPPDKPKGYVSRASLLKMADRRVQLIRSALPTTRRGKEFYSRSSNNLLKLLLTGLPSTQLSSESTFSDAIGQEVLDEPETYGTLLEVAAGAGFAIEVTQWERTLAVTRFVQSADTPLLHRAYRAAASAFSAWRNQRWLGLQSSPDCSDSPFAEFEEDGDPLNPSSPESGPHLDPLLRRIESAGTEAAGGVLTPQWAGDIFVRLGHTLFPKWPQAVIREYESDSPLDEMTAKWIESEFGTSFLDGLFRSRREADDGTEHIPIDSNKMWMLERVIFKSDAAKWFSAVFPEWKLVYGILPPDRWMASRPMGWSVVPADDEDNPDAPRFGLGVLSAAEQRWARFCIRLHFAAHESQDNRQRSLDLPRNSSPELFASEASFLQRVGTIILDEPERGLHRVAERRMADALATMSVHFPHVPIIVATHSPAFLDSRPLPVPGTQRQAPPISLLHVTRTPEGTGVESLELLPEGDLREYLQELGLHPSEVFQLASVFVLVEGFHDRVVFQTFFGEEFRRARVVLMDIDGCQKLKSQAQGPIFGFTDVPVCVVVDNTNETVVAGWNKLREEVASNPAAAEDPLAGQYLDSQVPRAARTPEYKSLKDLLEGLTRGRTRSTGARNIRRVELIGMAKPDILDYTDPGKFLGVDPVQFKNDYQADLTWDQLRIHHQNARASGKESFKSWVNRTHAGDDDNLYTDRQRIADALPQDQIPEEFQRIFEMIMELASSRSATGNV